MKTTDLDTSELASVYSKSRERQQANFASEFRSAIAAELHHLDHLVQYVEDLLTLGNVHQAIIEIQVAIEQSGPKGDCGCKGG